MRGAKAKLRNNRGVTLMEIAVVIAITAVVVGISVPAYLAWVPRYRLKSAAMSLFSDYQFTKMRAVQTSREWAVVFNVGTDDYQVVDSGADNVYGTGGDDVVMKTVRLSSFGAGVVYNDNTNFGDGVYADPARTYGVNAVVFNSRGMVTGNGDVLLRNARGAIYRVGTPTFAGAVRIQSWNGANWE